MIEERVRASGCGLRAAGFWVKGTMILSLLVVKGSWAQDTTAFVPGEFADLQVSGRWPLHPCVVAAWPYAVSNYRMDLRISGSYDSNVLRNALVKNLQRGGFIERSTREASRFEEGTMGRFGQSIDIKWNFYHCGVKPGKGLGPGPGTIAISYHDLLGARFTKDAFDLVFFGNKAYAGRSADLSRTAHERIRYMTLDFGMPGVFGKGSMFEQHIVFGVDLNTSDLRHAVLYTAPDGQDLQAVFRGSYLKRDTTQYAGFDNIGYAISARWLIEHRRKRAKYSVLLGFNDLGAIRWEKAFRLSAETSYTYRGIDVQDVFDVAGVVVDEQTAIDSLGITARHHSRVRVLPFKLYGVLYAKLGARSNGILSCDQRYVVGYLPHVRGLYVRSIGRHMSMGPSFDAGGFGSLGPKGWRLGLHMQRRTARWNVGLASSNIIGLFSDRARGAAAEVAVGYSW